MKRFAQFVALSISITGIVGLRVHAAQTFNPIQPTFQATNDVLLANRFRGRFSFQVRASRYRRGGFSRGCIGGESAAPIIPATPDDDTVENPAIQSPAYLTAASHPTVFFNTPALSNAEGVVTILDPGVATKDAPKIYEAGFTFTSEAGIVGVRMPSEAPALELGKSYRWQVVIECSPEDADGTGENTIVFKGGILQRVPDVEGTHDEQLAHYLEAGIWEDTVKMVAEDRYTNSVASADEEWAILMEASGLPQFASTPIVAIENSNLLED